MAPTVKETVSLIERYWVQSLVSDMEVLISTACIKPFTSPDQS